jgi:hypothetical protein
MTRGMGMDRSIAPALIRRIIRLLLYTLITRYLNDKGNMCREQDGANVLLAPWLMHIEGKRVSLKRLVLQQQDLHHTSESLGQYMLTEVRPTRHRYFEYSIGFRQRVNSFRCSTATALHPLIEVHPLLTSAFLDNQIIENLD